MQQSFSFGQINIPGQRNYVFVDEHNRHRRLKVMRACEGCRRRKIKCDAVTTNQWPCAACTRLRLHCVPPTMIDGEVPEAEQALEIPETSNYRFVDAPSQNPVQTQEPPTSAETQTFLDHNQDQDPIYETDIPTSSSAHYAPQLNQQFPYQNSYQTVHPEPSRFTSEAQNLQNPDTPSIARTLSDSSDYGSSTAEGFSEALGALRIDETGIAPYLQRPSKFVAEPAAPITENEVELPKIDLRYGSEIQIPPTMMPSDEQANLLFKIYFSDVHPYVPVVNRSHFFRQWLYDRASISPLLLEAMFACAGRLSDDSGQASQWLALLNMHEDSFLDTPRLSTIQALLLLLKAREAAPKRGYYYRSWMMCKTIASMAKDLDIHQHHGLHLKGQPCGSDLVECLTKTRVWQTLMICETMIGGPQGRYDYEVDPDSVDVQTQPLGPEDDHFEIKTSEQFAFLARNALNIRRAVQTYQEVKDTKDWGMHPKFLANNRVFDQWPEALPGNLQLCLPMDGRPPQIPSHFIANLHSYYHLARIMLQRPQLMAYKSLDAENSVWKQHMMSCYNSAKILCRLQEAILLRYGLQGLLCMQRGINFTIYAVLTCIMLHLVAITSPDPDFNVDARDYFTRHMRILEECIHAWPMKEMRVQIDALREAFSADKDKPFELKASFPYGSPSEPSRPSPPIDPPYQQNVSGHDSYNPQRAQNFVFQPMTPPISATSRDSGLSSPYSHQGQGITVAGDSGAQYAGDYIQPTYAAVEDQSWNPTPIFQQWNTAFSIPPSALAPPPSSTPNSQTSTFSAPIGLQPLQPSLSPPNSSSYLPQYSGSMSQPMPSNTTQEHNYRPQPQPPPPPAAPAISRNTLAASYVSPREWQRSVASVFNPDGLKRRLESPETQALKRNR